MIKNWSPYRKVGSLLLNERRAHTESMVRVGRSNTTVRESMVTSQRSQGEGCRFTQANLDHSHMPDVLMRHRLRGSSDAKIEEPHAEELRDVWKSSSNVHSAREASGKIGDM